MRERLSESWRLVRLNLRALAGFELLYKLAASMVFLPVLSRALELIMRARGYSYLTMENVAGFLAHPLTFLLLMLLVGALTFCAMLDVGAVIFALDQSAQGRRVQLTQVARFCVQNALRVLKRQNVLLSLIVLVLIPFLHAGVASSLIGSLSLPEFIEDFIQSQPALTALFFLLVLLLEALLMRWIFAFHYFTLEGCGFREARARSAHLSRNRRLRALVAIIGVQVFSALLHAGLISLGTVLIVLMDHLFAGAMRIVTSALVWLVIALSSAVVGALSMPLGYGAISALYYRWKARDGEISVHAAAPAPPRRRLARAANLSACAILIVGGALTAFGVYTGRINPNIEYMHTTEVTAHRGASANYPENTMAAFRGAVELGADWIELDVQQSADGEIFVMHDANLRRTTGVDAYSWELTYADIRALDAGSSFGEEFAGEPVPLLSEAIDFARESGVRLNIELKPNGHEIDFEERVVALILDADFAESCVVTSQVYSVLERVKEISDEITTVYVMSFAYGNVNRLEAADHFSIEASSVTRRLVSRVHNAGKQLYVWTVNSPRRMDAMIDFNVDNIITDRVPLAKERVYNNKYSTLVDAFVKALR